MHPNVTQKDIAKKFKVTPGAVCLWERGATEPNSETLAQLARMYHVSVDWLVGLQDSRTGGEAKASQPIHVVPVVSARALSKWNLDNVLEYLQTMVAYPMGMAAGLLVASEALTSACPTGSYAVISRTIRPQPGCIVLAATSKVGEPILRRYVKDGDDALLVADDVRWPTVRLDPGVRVVGTVVEVTVRKLLM